MKPRNETLLVVDRQANHRKSLAEPLLAAGYCVLEAGSGGDALARVPERPELLLLGIPLADMDGVDLCRRLRGEASTRHLPVIFVADPEGGRSKAQGFDAGGSDWIVRPVDAGELLARVRMHLDFDGRRREMAATRDRLAALCRETTRVLIQRDRLATLCAYSASVAHEINNPVSYIMGNVELIRYTWQEALPILERHFESGGGGGLEKSARRLDRKLTLILEGAERISRLVRDFKTQSRTMAAEKKECRLLTIVNEASDLLIHRFKRGYKLAVDVADELTIYGDPLKLSQVFVNLFSGAMDAMGPDKGRITISAARHNGHVDIRVADSGPPKERAAMERISDPEALLRADAGHGSPGLFVVRSIIEDHHGTIRLEGGDETGTRFDIQLPVNVN